MGTKEKEWKNVSLQTFEHQGINININKNPNESQLSLIIHSFTYRRLDSSLLTQSGPRDPGGKVGIQDVSPSRGIALQRCRQCVQSVVITRLLFLAKFGW